MAIPPEILNEIQQINSAVSQYFSGINQSQGYYENSSKILPDTILFETNGHNKLEDSIQIIKRLETFGYKLFTGDGSTDNFIEFDKEHLSFDCKAVLMSKNRIKINKEIIHRLFNQIS